MPAEPPDDTAARRGREQDAWSAFGLLVAGVLVWGGVGFLVSDWLHNPLPKLVGLLVGMGGGLYAVWLRYGSPDHGPTGSGPAGGGRTL